MAQWPAELVITREGYMETPPNRIIRSDMDVGPAKIRRRSSSAVRPVTLKLFLTDDQLDVLDQFYEDNDALAFDFVIPRNGETVRARFTDAPPYEVNELNWNVVVQLEILP